MKFSTEIKTLLYAMETSHGVRRALMSALGLVYFLSFGFDIVWVTTLFAVSTIIMTFFEFPTGAIADYDSRKKSMMISYFLMSLAFFGLFFFDSFWLLAFSWILGDIAWTFFSGSSSAWAIDALKIGKKKSDIVSLISRGYIFEKGGHIVGGLAGLILISIDFRLIWLFVSLSQLFMFFVLWKYMEERNFKPGKFPHSYLKKSLIKAKESFDFVIHKKNRQLRVLMIGDFLGMIAGSGFAVGMPLLFVQEFGIGPETLSGFMAMIAAVAIFGPIIAENFIRVKGMKYSFVLFLFLDAFLMINFSVSVSLFLAVGILMILRINGAILDVISNSAFQHEFDSKIRASLGSVSNVIWAIANSIAVFLAGIFIDFFGVVVTLLIFGLFGVLEALVYLFGLKRD